MTARFIVGDVFDVLATLEPDSVDLVFSSPPFLALRSYLPADHPDKAKEIGSEATPADFLDTLLDVVEACDRVLAPHGSLCFELGDTFADSGQSPNQKFGEGNAAIIGEGDIGRHRPCGPGYPLSKSLCLIPTLFAASLAYGYNMLRPERLTPRWRIRNLVVWARPNPPVGALGDKFRPATSYVTVATKSRTRYFDLDAVREMNNPDRMDEPSGGRPHMEKGLGNQSAGSNGGNWNPAGAPPLDYWTIPTAPYKGSHYATFPPDLVVKPVKAMCPLRVCRVCGEPSRRITEAHYIQTRNGADMDHKAGKSLVDHSRDAEVGNREPAFGGDKGVTRISDTLGWTDCGHDDWRTGTVLDPFAGSGTALAVATGHGRDAIGIDLDERNADLALERVGPMLLTVEHLNEEPAA